MHGTPTTIARLLPLLSHVHPSGTGWMARCPSHDDRVCSLSIGCGTDGRALLYCHAGCSVGAITDAMGLTPGDLFLAPMAPRSDLLLAEYVYRDETGTPHLCVRRYAPKSFRRFRADGQGGWTPGTAGCRALLYRLPELRGQRAVVIVEGEKDADRLWSVDIAATTSGGVTSWKPDHVAQLRWAGVRHVIVCPDHDPPGRTAGERISTECHAAGFCVRLVDLPGLPEKGDVSDWLDQGHTAAELRALINGTPRVGSAARVPHRQPILTKLSSVQVEPIDWLWPRHLARRKITLWAGDPGEGKSFAATDCAARLSYGVDWPDGTPAERGRTLILAAEDGVSDTIASRFAAVHGDPERLTVLEGIRGSNGLSTPWSIHDVDVLDEALAQSGADLLILDPLMAYMRGTDTFKDSDIRSAMAPLVPLIERRNVALLAIMHLNKNEQSRALYRVGGSVAFVGLARLGFLFGHDPHDPERRVMAPVKANLCQAAPAWAFRITNEGLQWESHPCYLDTTEILRNSRSQRHDHHGSHPPDPKAAQVPRETDRGGWH